MPALVSLLRKLAWAVSTALALLLVAVLAHLAIATILARWPAADPRPAPADAIEVWLRSNGVHVEFVLPAVTAVHDWKRDFPHARPAAGGMRDPAWVAFGWGSREFFVNVPEWKDFRLRVAVRALLFDRTVVPVEDLDSPPANPAGQSVPGAIPGTRGGARRIVLAPDGYAALVDHVRASLARGDDGLPVAVPGAGYGAADEFYEGTGRYSAIETCNEWVNVGLKRAGIPTPPWTPYAQALVPGDPR